MRSGEISDIKRIIAEEKRWEREIPYLKRTSFGRYAPGFCYGKSGLNIDLRGFEGGGADFVLKVDAVMRKRYYQAESRRKYLGVIKQFLAWLKVPVSRVNDRCIYAYLDGLLRRNVKPATYSLHLSALRTVFDGFCGLEITGDLRLPECCVRSEAADTIPACELELLLSAAETAREQALITGLLFLDLSVFELLNIRKCDMIADTGNIKVWSGPGREEREVSLPSEIQGVFISRLKEIGEDEYMFSAVRSPLRALSRRGADMIVAALFERCGLKYKMSCFKLMKCNSEIKVLNSGLSSAGNLSVGRGSCVKRCRGNRPASASGSGMVSVGRMRVDLGDLQRYRHRITAKAGFVIDGIEFSGIKLTQRKDGEIKVVLPDMEEWGERCLWLSREQKERIYGSLFRDYLQGVFKDKFREKSRNCYIRNSGSRGYWRSSA